MNKRYYGDNLDVLRSRVATESVDLVYLDPPFNSNASYNVLFKAPGGAQSQAQIEAFDDTWHWNESAEAGPARFLSTTCGEFFVDELKSNPYLRKFWGPGYV